MSDLPPPTPEPGLIDRLRKITGLTEPVPWAEPEPPPEPPYEAPPPVDKLMAGMRDGFTLAVGCGIAVGVLGVALGMRVYEGIRPAARAAGRKSREWGTRTAAATRQGIGTVREKIAAAKTARAQKAEALAASAAENLASAAPFAPTPPTNAGTEKNIAAKKQASEEPKQALPALEQTIEPTEQTLPELEQTFPTSATSEAIGADVAAKGQTLGKSETASAGTDEAFQELEHPLPEIPHTLAESPQTQGEIPQTQGEVAQTLAEIPQTLGKVAQTLGEIPQTLGEVAQTLGESPQTQGEVAQTLGEPAQRLGNAEKARFEPEMAPAQPDSALSEPSLGSAAPTRRGRFRALVFAPAALLLVLGALAAIPAVRYRFTDWLGSGNARVVAGAEGWIFLRSELTPAAAAPSLKETAAALRARCENLVVLSLPARAVVYADKTSPDASARVPRDPAVTAALAELGAAGASVLDLAPLLSTQKAGDAKDGPLFNPQDPFWSPRGMIYCASAAAAHIQQQPAFAALPMNPALAIMEPVTAPAAPGALVAEWHTDRSRARYSPVAHPLIRLVTPDKKEPLPDDPASGLVVLGGPALAAYDSAGISLPGTAVPAAGFGRHLAFLLNTTAHLHPAATAPQAAAAWLEEDAKTKPAPRKIIVWLLEDADFLTPKE